jgi:hypothetical protein
MTEPGRPCCKLVVPFPGCRDCRSAQSSALRIDRNSNGVGFVSVDADDDLIHGGPFAGMARAPIEEDTVRIR